jgi:hypothetical protein
MDEETGRQSVDAGDTHVVSKAGTAQGVGPSGESTEGRTVEIPLKTLALLAGVILVAIAVGVSAYFYGKGTGEDLDAAREQGAKAGKAKGTARGTAQGLAMGLRKGRERGFNRAYAPAYKKAYAQAFVDSGLEKPAAADIPVPKP